MTTGFHDAAALWAAGADVVLIGLADFPHWLDDHVLGARLAALDGRLHSAGSIVVAFSGGADSAFLLAASARALGPDRVLAATAVSPSLPRRELLAARRFAEDLGVRHLTPRTDEMSRPGYRANDGDRCYFCKAELLDVIAPLAAHEGFATVATGTNADDAAAGFRPGIRAAAERGAVTPLLDAGLTKAQIREASRRWGLPTWDKPAAACLSSRVAYGVEITPARLARVDRAEAAVRSDADEPRVSMYGICECATSATSLGSKSTVTWSTRWTHCPVCTPLFGTSDFPTVEVDPAGFRSGSMNELLPEPARFR